MGNLRALSRMPVQVPIYAAVLFATSLLLPVAAGASTGSHPSKAPAPAAVGAQLAPARLAPQSRRELARQRPAGRAHATRHHSARTAAQTALPTGLDLLLGRLAGSGALAPQTLITCAAPGGNWSSPGTWTGGVVPTAADDVLIGSGCTVTIDTAAAALNVSVSSGGTLQYEDTTARTLAVGANVTVDAGGTLQSAATGTQTGHILSVGANLVNAGTIDLSTNADTAGASITFTGAANASLNNSGTLDLRTMTLNKGTSAASMLDFLPGGTITVQGANTAGFLTITNGTFRVAGSGTLTNPVFAAAAYTIPATGGFWLNDANATVVGQSGNPANNGSLRVTDGTLNVGTLGTNVMGAAANASFTIEGGTVNVAGRLTSANAVTYTQSAGTVNICVVGGCATTPSFGFTSTLPTNVMNISGGTINFVNSNTLTTADYNQQGTINFSGGTVQFGTAATATNFTFRLQGSAPNVVIDNTTNAKTLLLSGTAWVYGNFTVSTGSTLNPNNAILNMFGSTFTNNGTIGPGIVGGATTSRLQFAGAGAQTYTGTGTAGTPADPLFGLANINRGGGLTIDPSVNPIYVARLLAFSGSLTNANKVSLTQATTNVMVIQRGGVAQLPAGTIDVAPSFTTTSAALILVYSQASNAATTGVEVPASRTVESVQDFNTNGITIAGGPLTVTGNAGASPDTVGLFLGGTAAGTAGGPVNTSPSNLLTVAGTGVAALAGGSENAYVNGPLARILPASLAGTLTYLFPVGKSSYKAIELVNPTTAVGGTVTVQAEAFDADSGGTAGTGLDAINHNRYWYAQITSGAANFTSSSVRVTELNSANNALGQSAALNGAYDSIGGTLLPATVQSAAPTTSLGYFAVGRVATTPTFPGGTYTVGATGNYTTLTAAMADLSGRLITGPITYALQADYSSAAETFPIVVPANGGSSATNTITIKPDTGVTATISGSSASSIIKLNGADYVTIDGSADGSGSRDLTIQNTSARQTRLRSGSPASARPPAQRTTRSRTSTSAPAR